MKYGKYSETCVRKPPLRLTLVVDVERWLSYKGTCHVILLAKLHDMYIYKTATFPHQPSLFKVGLTGGSLTQVSLYIDIFLFCWKNVSSFCIAKATHIFAAKISMYLKIP